MKSNKDRAKTWRSLSLISQVSISMLTPVFMMIFLCAWLKNKFGFGDWIIIVGILLGIGSGFTSVWKQLKKFLK